MSRQPGWYDISEGRPWVCSARRNTYPQLAEKINANVYKGLIHVNTTVKEQVYWQMPYTARFLTILLQFISLNIPIRALNTFFKKKKARVLANALHSQTPDNTVAIYIFTDYYYECRYSYECSTQMPVLSRKSKNALILSQQILHL